jgi:hypothetical protein
MLKKNKKLLVRNCKVCGQRISIREMPSGQLEGFDVDTDNLHEHTEKEIEKKLEGFREETRKHRSGLRRHIEETNRFVQKNISEKEYAIFRRSERIAENESRKKRYTGLGIIREGLPDEDITSRAIKSHYGIYEIPEFTEKEKEEFEEKKQQYDEEVANIRTDLEVLKKKLENNTDTTSANIEHLNQEIKELVDRCEELFDKEGFRKPCGGVFEDAGGKTHWDDWGDDGARGVAFYEFPISSDIYELPISSNKGGGKYIIKDPINKIPEILRKAKLKNPEQFEEMYVGNREWFWLKKPTPSKISSVVQKLKSLFQTS